MVRESVRPPLRRVELAIASVAHTLTLVMLLEHFTRLNPSTLPWLITLIPIALTMAIFKRLAILVIPVIILYVTLNPYFHWSLSLFYISQPRWLYLDVALSIFAFAYMIVRAVARRWNWGPLLMFLTAFTGTLYAVSADPTIVWIHTSVALVFGAYLLQNLHWLFWPYPLLWALYRRKVLKMI